MSYSACVLSLGRLPWRPNRQRQRGTSTSASRLHAAAAVVLQLGDSLSFFAALVRGLGDGTLPRCMPFNRGVHPEPQSHFPAMQAKPAAHQPAHAIASKLRKCVRASRNLEISFVTPPSLDLDRTSLPVTRHSSKLSPSPICASSLSAQVLSLLLHSHARKRASARARTHAHAPPLLPPPRPLSLPPAPPLSSRARLICVLRSTMQAGEICCWNVSTARDLRQSRKFLPPLSCVRSRQERERAIAGHLSARPVCTRPRLRSRRANRAPK